MTYPHTMIKGFYWHVHHDKLIEWCYNYQERVEAIKEKPKNEIETRLRLLKPVKNFKVLPKKWVEAYKKFMPELEALHKKECGCKEWNGKEIVFK